LKRERSPIHQALWANTLLITFAIALGLAKTGNPSRYFGEGRFTTAFSCFQLLLTAMFAGRIFAVRRAAATMRGFRAGYWVWLLVSVGFVFLALDDALQIHEKIDHWIGDIFHLKHGPWKDRIDDAVIGAYGFIGLGVLWTFRGELRQFRVMLKPLGYGFGCLCASIICDTLSNNLGVFLWLTRGDRPLARKLDGWFSVGDGAFTLLAEGLFAAAFLIAWRVARRNLEPVIEPERSGSNMEKDAEPEPPRVIELP
jgi:hypothetical protein